MISLGLSAANHQKLLALLKSSHHINVKIQVLDLNHNYISDVSTRLVDGQIDVDGEALITRSGKLILFDPTHALHLDSNSPDEGALFMDRMIRIVYNVRDPLGTFSVDIPLICGPIRKLDRTGVLLNVEIQGKEVLALPTAWKARTWPKGWKKTAVILSILQGIGEKKWGFIQRWPTTTGPVNMGQSNTPWGVARSIATGMRYQLYYDARGYAQMRQWPQLTCYTFTEAVLKSEPQVGYDISNLVNAVEVIGPIPKGALGYIGATAVAPATHPLSPQKLARNGIPQYYPKIIQDSNIKTNVYARTVATLELRGGLLMSISVAFQALPGVAALLEPGDICRLETSEFNVAFRVNKFSIPLTAKGTCAVGYNKKVTPNRTAIRLRRR